MKVISINLLGFEEKERVKKFLKPKVDNSILIGVLFIVIAVAINIIATTIIDSLKNTAMAQKSMHEEVIKKLENKLQELKTLEEKRDALIREQKILEYVTGKTFKWSKFLEEFRSLIPDNVWLNSCKIGDDFSCNLSCSTLTYRSIGLFMVNLQNSNYFQNIVLETSEKITQEGQEIIKFNINCKINTEVK